MTKLYKKNQKSFNREYAKKYKKDSKDREIQNKKMLVELQNLSITFDYDTDKFHTSSKPTNNDKKVYDITELKDGSYIYEKKQMD